MSYDKFIESSNVVDYAVDYYNAKAAHCIKLHESIEKRVAFSLIKKDAIENILKYKKKELDDWREDLIKSRSTAYGPAEKFNYVDINISSDFTLEMLINEFFSHIHSIFDLVAFLINETILKCGIKKVSSVTYRNVMNKLKESDSNLELIQILDSITDSDWYKYIDEFNNLAKHRYLTDITSSSYLDTGEIRVKISEFERKEKHEEIEAFDVVYICFDEVLIFLNKVFKYIKSEIPKITFEDRYNRDDMYYKIQMSSDSSSRGASAFLITGEKTYKANDELYIGIAFKDEENGRIKIADKNNAYRVFLKHNKDDNYPYAIAEQDSNYKQRSRQSYMKYKVKMSDDIERDMIVDFFEPKIAHGNIMTDEIILIHE